MTRHDAYTALLMRHHTMLWRMCWHRAHGDRDLCCDLLQEISIALWENYDKLRPNVTQQQERAWVRWQARSVFFQIGRRQTLPTEPITDTISDSVSDEDAQHRKELLDDLIAVLEPEEQRMMHLYLEGYHGDEIGQQIGISRDAVYQRMHRAVQKMRRVVLILLAMLIVVATAVAITPQWRQTIFSGGGSEEEVVDSLPEQSKTILPVSVINTDTTPSPRTDSASSRLTVESLEHIPPLDIQEILGIPNEPFTLSAHDDITISISGTNLIIMGACGELVRVYDLNGKYVAYKVAGGFCLINLFPNLEDLLDYYFDPNIRSFRLQIGSRPPLLLQLQL